MNTCCLSKDIRAHNRRVSGDPLAREIFNHAAKRSDTCLVYSERHAHLIAQRHGNLGKRGVSCPLAETVYCAMNRVDADFHRREGIGRCEAVVVMWMKIEGLIWEPRHHVSERLADLFGGQQAQSVWQQVVTDTNRSGRLDKTKNIVGAVGVTIRPIL